MSRRAGLSGSAYTSRDYYAGDNRHHHASSSSSHRKGHYGSFGRRGYGDDHDNYDRGASSGHHYISYAQYPVKTKSSSKTTTTGKYADSRETKRGSIIDKKHVHWPDDTFYGGRGGSGSKDRSHRNHHVSSSRRHDYADDGNHHLRRTTTHYVEASPRVAAANASRRRHHHHTPARSGDGYGATYADEVPRRTRKTRGWF